MNSAGQVIWSSSARVLSVIGVIACLCFSAGEGLRLTPLPALSLGEISSSVLHVNATLSHGTPRYLGGPLNRPAQAQVQKISKRKLLDCECPPTSGMSDIAFHPLPYLDAGDWSDRASRIPQAQPPSRAPPFIS
jgi:hypothetical protein